MFSDLTGITPGDEDAYARVLIGLWQAPGAWQKDSDGQVMRRFLKERCVPDAAAQWVYDAAQWAYDGRVVANARRDVLARGDEWLIHVAATWCSNVPPGFARTLADKGRWWDAVACLSAPSDVLVEAVEPLVAEAKDKQSRRNVLSRVITHGNFPPEVRREVAPWLKTSLWAVARDGFLGRV